MVDRIIFSLPITWPGFWNPYRGLLLVLFYKIYDSFSNTVSLLLD